MNELTERLARLSPEQQKLLHVRLRQKGHNVAVRQETFTKEPVLHLPDTGRPTHGTQVDRPNGAQTKKMAFSLLFFSGDGVKAGADKYDFLLDCARFADQNGLCAIWTPERHFQTFGGLFPNPSVLSAALAMVTDRVQIRAGSVVIPLHHPIRLAEEWAVVDNLSKGRVAISLATGWSRGDFTLAPEKFAERRAIAFQNLAIIQQLWAGECVSFAGVDGKPFDVTILPRPVQPSLPVWVTVSGNPETWVQAGELGANVLTSMIGTPDDLRPGIASYRQARAAHGHDPATGIVSVMMHTFIGEDEPTVKEQVKEPLCRYLQTFIGQQDILRPTETGVDANTLSARDRHELVLFAFERYFQQSGLLGTPAKCTQMVDRMQAVGVDEIACLVDFGVAQEAIETSLQHVAALCTMYSPSEKCVES